MTSNRFELLAETASGSERLTFDVDRLVCCGWVGRDPAALQAHIDELAHLGVPPPTRVPIYMNFSPYLLTTDDHLDVVSGTTSGEVEYVLICRGDQMLVTVGSDQTDREVETTSIVASKQMCSKHMARRCWRYGDVASHWDRLQLRSWVSHAGRRQPYQDAPLSSILDPDTLLSNLPGGPVASGTMVLYSGTIATKTGLVYGDAYELELHDPVLGRSIDASYRVVVLPQYV